MNWLFRNFLGGCLLYIQLGLPDLVLLFWTLYTLKPLYICLYLVFAFVVSKLTVRRSNVVLDFLYEFYHNWFNDHRICWNDRETENAMKKGDKKLLFCHHPHGAFVHGVWMHGILDPDFRKAGVTTFGHDTILSVPFISIFVRLVGAESCAKANMKKHMKAGKTPCILVPGGGDEMIMAEPGIHTLFIKKRKGFIKYCLQFGYSPVSVFHFGETELYNVVKLPSKTATQRNWFMLLFFFFRYFFVRGWMWLTVLPKRKNLYTFVGEMLKMPHIDNPSKEDVDKFHEAYVQKLIETREIGIEKMKADPDTYKQVEFGTLDIV